MARDKEQQREYNRLYYIKNKEKYTLKGKNVRGLHILENLQYLTKSENRKKSNKIA